MFGRCGRRSAVMCSLMVDANHAYSLSEALSFARQIEPSWTSASSRSRFRPRITKATANCDSGCRFRSRAGNANTLLAGFRHLLSNRCVDIAQPDICGAGGLTETKRIAALAYAFQTNVIPHSWGTGIAFAAGLHLVSTLDVVPGRLRMPEAMLEMDRSENALRENLTAAQVWNRRRSGGGAGCAGTGRGCRSGLPGAICAS